MSFKMNEHHWMVLIDFMESHLSFARGQFSGPTGKINQKKLWVELTQKLNSLGYGEKTTEKWQKTWADIKYLLKKKVTLIKKDISMTGGGAGSQSKLNAYEERIVGILGKSFIEGVGSTECGLIITDGLPKKTSCMMSPAIKLQGQIPSTITEGINPHDLPKRVPSATAVHEEIGELNIDGSNTTVLNDVDYIEHNFQPCGKENNSNILAATVIDQKVANHDHLYCKKSKRKPTAEEVEKELYLETIDELREIKRGVFSISDHMMSMSETLKDIRNILNQNQQYRDT